MLASLLTDFIVNHIVKVRASRWTKANLDDVFDEVVFESETLLQQFSSLARIARRQLLDAGEQVRV